MCCNLFLPDVTYAGCNLRIILEWAWDQVIQIKQHLDQLCKCIYNSGRNSYDIVYLGISIVYRKVLTYCMAFLNALVVSLFLTRARIQYTKTFPMNKNVKLLFLHILSLQSIAVLINRSYATSKVCSFTATRYNNSHCETH